LAPSGLGRLAGPDRAGAGGQSERALPHSQPVSRSMIKMETIPEHPHATGTTDPAVQAPPVAAPATAVVWARDFWFFYGQTQALHGIDLHIPENRVTALIGPSGCGKSTFLRSINRLNDLIPGSRQEGKIFLNGESVYDPRLDVVALRKRVGMVFQKSN